MPSGFRTLAAVLLAALILPGVAAGQGGLGKGRLTGSVVDNDGQPVPGAKIALKFIGKDQAAFETKTDFYGRWNYNGLARGTWNVAASAEGYGTANRNVTILELSDNPRVPLVLERLASGVTGQDKSALLEKANELYYARAYDDALALYKRYLALEPEDNLAALSVAYCLQGKGDVDAAGAEFKAIAERTAKDPRSSYETSKAVTGLAECAMARKDTAAALAFYKRAFELAPEDELLAYNIGEIHFNGGNAGAALPFYLEACRIAPSWSDPLYRIGLAYVNVRDLEKARAAFTKFLTLEPRTPRAAQVRTSLKDLEKK